jgi:hypothetical protein
MAIVKNVPSLAKTNVQGRDKIMNIYLITFDFSHEYGLGYCLVAAKNEDEAKTYTQRYSLSAHAGYLIKDITLLNPNEYPNGGFIKDIVFIG